MTDMLNITPGTKLLVALTRAPLVPFDAMCGLARRVEEALTQARELQPLGCDRRPR
jgi:hypothetical protein